MSFQNALLKWFEKSQRPLPWRRHYRPYEVWISEVMLQQTQVETALPYYDRWLKEFPDVKTLARADEKKVLKMWEGLGYYSRARNVHHTARQIADKFNGKFPDKFEDILSLKGIGRYSAGAIASIAFNQEKPIVDGNVLRVLSRLYAIDKPIDVIANREAFWELQEKLIPKGQARHFNQALMELGALICTKQNPSCLICPVRQHCRAYKLGKVESFPLKQNKKAMVRVTAAAVVLQMNGKFLIERRPEGKIMGGLWEFPEWKLARDKKMKPAEIARQAQALAAEKFGLKENLKPLGIIKRNYTHHLESLYVFEVDAGEIALPKDNWQRTWASTKEFAKHPFSSAHAKITRLLL
jgi:A/G-specific adenine glycosylase